MASNVYAMTCGSDGLVAELRSMPTGFCCWACFLRCFARFCFCLRMPLSLSALICISG